ncbi:universal stress protein [Salinibacter ruber]|uniref:universal stress protein n=1 Tax=Salinibacter ruber TaxID=146919 RepID=UPI002169D02C|nr:universal stress protein [Salinibacter ruber]
MHDIPPSVMPSAPSSDRSFRRILVALDASPHSRAALDLAVQLAADLEANLEGLFVKDENLIRAAQLPFAAEVRTHSVSPKALNDRRVQRRLRRQADQAEAVLQAATEQAPVSYDFRVVEGQVTRQLLRAAEEADLVALGKTSTQSSRRRLGTTSEALLAESSTPVLVLRRAPRRRPPPSAYYDGSETAQQALRMAAGLADRGVPRTVFLSPGDETTTEQLRGEVHEVLGAPPARAQVHPLTPAEVDRLAALARRRGPGLFVMPGTGSPLVDASLQRFLYELDRPLLLVR